ncbi:MAG: aminotransferase class III-fold pyridoxal phosphate-dependent enzyme [Candidatus Electrothrix sp. AS4_5]|nr:aminotransferase class III-fold pyridoxal phosphate-dependent enzyme [Candidatus Electrothrix gigas]MCI5190057.1 aminotransferase class III-fold pyridoxal phosphate-dependent enzyme [Candidatus Electrothrix gigas]
MVNRPTVSLDPKNIRICSIIFFSSSLRYHLPDVQQLFERGCLINFAGMRVLRFIPPLTVTQEDIDQLIGELSAVLHEVG